MIMILLIVFFVLILFVGGDRGAVSFLTIIGNLFLFFTMIVAMSMGLNPYLVTILGCVGINCLTLFYQNGKNVKMYSAFISVVCIMTLLLAIVFLFCHHMHLEGLNEIELQGELPIYYSFVVKVNMHQVSICLILIGLLGAVMDTAVAISSGLYEIAVAKKRTKNELFLSGLTIGRDILSTTVNTLYFAYIGEALMFLIFLKDYKYSLTAILNSKAFLQDFGCILFSMIGCLLIIPVNSFISSRMFSAKSFMEMDQTEKNSTM